MTKLDDELRDVPLWLLERVEDNTVFDRVLIDNPNLRWNAPYSDGVEQVISGPYWGKELVLLALDIYGKAICFGRKPSPFLIHCHANTAQTHLLTRWLRMCSKYKTDPSIRRLRNG